MDFVTHSWRDCEMEQTLVMSIWTNLSKSIFIIRKFPRIIFHLRAKDNKDKFPLMEMIQNM